jgi:hypothetical protein
MHSDGIRGSLRVLIPATLLVGAVALVLSVFLGGQVSTVLSTVGAAIPEDAAGAPREAPAAGAEDGSGGTTGQLPDDGTPPLSAPLPDDRRVVYTGSLELVVDDLPAALARAKAAVLATGGYIGASQERDDGERAVATVTYRIPSTRWDDTVETLRGMASRIVGGETQATEVGDQIVDLEARLRNLRASETVLVGIAEGTGRITDLLEVQARISDVRGEIERLDAQRARLEDQASYGTLVATFGTEIVQVQETAKGWDPADDVDGAMATVIEAGQSIVSAAIWFGIVWLPVILALVLVALVLRWAARRFLRGAATPGGGPVPGWGGEG